MLKVARMGATPIAVAIFFVGEDALFGRYWGAGGNYHSLHFETCYYQGIEFCIERGLQRFEPGTQGEHKVPRGFVPDAHPSAHDIADPRFARGDSRLCARARRAASTTTPAAVDEHVPVSSRGGRGVAPLSRLVWLAPSDPIRIGFRRSSRRCSDPPGLLAAGGDSEPGAAAGGLRARHLPLVLGTASRSCGGRPIRAWCCFPRNSTARAASRKTLRNGGFETASTSDFGATIRACAAPRRARPGHLAERRT